MRRQRRAGGGLGLVKVPKGLASITVGWIKVLSPMDKVFIGKFYPFKVAMPPEEELKVGGDWVEGEIKEAGQTVGYRFDASKGHYVIETKGPTPLLMGLFGPTVVPTMQGGGAAEGTDAKLEGDLDPADLPSKDDEVTYRLDVRHQTPRNGTGKFSIRVRRS